MAILSIGELLGMGPSELSGLVPYSGLDYSGSVITGISGSALGGTNSATVSAIASAYAESAVSSKVDQSAFDDCCSAVNDALSGISGAVSAVTGKTGNYIDWSSSGAFQPSGNYQTAGDYAFNSALTAYQPIGDYAYNSSLSGKLDNSASSTWYPKEGNPSGFLTEHQSLSGYATEEYVDSSVSGKQDASGMSAYATTGDLSSKLDASSINFDGDSSHVTGISGVPLSAQGGGGGGQVFPMDIILSGNPYGVLDTGDYYRDRNWSHDYSESHPALIISAAPDQWGWAGNAAFVAVRESADDGIFRPRCTGVYASDGLSLADSDSAYGLPAWSTQINCGGVFTIGTLRGSGIETDVVNFSTGNGYVSAGSAELSLLSALSAWATSQGWTGMPS